MGISRVHLKLSLLKPTPFNYFLLIKCYGPSAGGDGEAVR